MKNEPPSRREVPQVLEDHRDIEVVAEASSGAEAIERATQVRPDVAVLDVRMQPVSGISAIPGILKDFPRTAVLMLSIHNAGAVSAGQQSSEPEATC